MLHKEFDLISEEDIEYYISNEVNESKHLEFKEKLFIDKDREKKEFLADVSSFANASGGYLVYGIKCNKGIAIEAVGIDIDNIDDLILRLHNIIRDNIEPRIHGVEIKSIGKYQRGGPVIIIHVPTSWSKPHMVTFRSSPRFYSRHSNGKYPLDYGEIRDAFVFSNMLPERIRTLYHDRIDRITKDKETPIYHDGKNFLSLHIIPYSLFEKHDVVDMKSLKDNFNEILLLDGRSPHESRYNIDGLLVYSINREEDRAKSLYCQVYRNGMIESVDANYIIMVRNRPSIYPEAIECKLNKVIERYIEIMRNMQISTPIVILICLNGVGGARAYYNERMLKGADRNIIILPETVYENYKDNIITCMKTTYDALWNSFGHPQSPNYGK